MGRAKKYSDELRRRAIDEVLERGRKVAEVAAQLGIASPETLRRWVRQAEADRGLREAPTSEELAEIRRLRVAVEVDDDGPAGDTSPGPTVGADRRTWAGWYA